MAINPVVVKQNQGEYINTTSWRNVILNGNVLIFPVSITGFSSNHRVFEYALESGTGNAVEFSGRQPYEFTLDVKIVGRNEDHYDSQLQFLLSLLNTSMTEPIEIYHPIVKKYKINKFYVLGWAYKEIDFYAVYTIRCKEYKDYIVQYLDGFVTPEQDVASNITQEQVEEVEDTFSPLIGNWL